MTYTYSWSLTSRPYLNFADSLQCMAKTHPCLCLHHLPTTHLNFYLENCIFFPFKHWQLLSFPAYVHWNDNTSNHFPSSWDHCSSPSTGFPFTVTLNILFLIFLTNTSWRCSCWSLQQTSTIYCLKFRWDVSGVLLLWEITLTNNSKSHLIIVFQIFKSLQLSVTAWDLRRALSYLCRYFHLS